MRIALQGVGVLLLAAVAAIAVISCFGGSPKSRHYALGAAAVPEGQALATFPQLGLVVGPIDFPRYLDRPEIVTRDGAHGLSVSETNRWAGSLRSDFLRVLADQLGRRVGTERVVAYPNEARFRVDYRVQVELVAFEGQLGEGVALRARWVVASGDTGRALVAEVSDLREPTASASWDDLVAAHGRALDALSGEIAARIVALASRPTDK